MRRSFFARLLVNAAALWVATRLVPGVEFTDGVLPFLAVAIVFGVVNTVVGTVVKILALPFIIVTLGLFLVVINAALLWLTSVVAGALGLGFHVRGFVAAVAGALIVSVVSMVLGLMVIDKQERKPKKSKS